MLKLNRLFFLSAILLSTALLINSCALPKEPQIKGISKFKVNRDNEQKQVQFDMGIDVFNPNRYKIKIVGYDLQVYINGAMVGEATSKDRTVLPKLERNTVSVLFRTDLKKVVGGITSMLLGAATGDAMKLKVTGYVKAKAKGIPKKVPVDYEKEFLDVF